MRVVPAGSALVGIVVAAQIGVAQSTPTSIEGVWKGVSIADSGPVASTNPSRLPNILIYTKKYYSRIIQDVATPLPPRPILAPPADPNKLTQAEMLARYQHWAQFAVQAGTYEIKGTALVQYPLVNLTQSAAIIARNAGQEATNARIEAGQQIKLEGNTLVLTGTSADGKSSTRATYTRLESAADVEARPPAAPSIAGVWLGTSYVATGANAVANPNRQPNIFIYTKGYYSTIRQDSDTTPPLPPRPVLAPPKDPNKLTDAEKLARYEHWAPVSADAGKYEVKGTAFYQYPLVSKNQSAAIVSRNQTGNMGTSTPNSEIKFEGSNTMVQIATSPDGKTVTRRTYTRLE